MKAFLLVCAVSTLICIPALTESTQNDVQSHCSRTMGMAMPASKLAEIRVYPMQQFKDDQQDLQRIQEIVRELRADNAAGNAAASSRHVEMENELFSLIDKHLERVTSDRGKSDTAVGVQTKLNQMEGRMMCGACHGKGMGPMRHGMSNQ